MRLTRIKLAGFKSFVDPTDIPVPGALVGVVGPNGCGKSNVIDAVRWVLGESHARHLRGETMQDVIFNGAGTRKPVGRASVELVFDNSLGKAAGRWSEYAEISVKRVLSRNAESVYYVNNVHVRRRDVADIFLGTGLGGRAYGIIEQGMISRIIEAKPEELRVFLEEAAGVSKYRERRRETEARLADTRRNMLRVDDIRRDLANQLEHLAEQARVAERYHALKREFATTQQLSWWLKKNEAAQTQARLRRDIDKLTIELEAETAKLRATEARLEALRAEHYEHSAALHVAQGEMYAAAGEVARFEQEIAHRRDRRARIEQQVRAIQTEVERQTRQRTAAQNGLADWRREAEAAHARSEQSWAEAAAENERLPLAEQKLRECRDRLHDARGCRAEAEKHAQIEATRCEHGERNLQQLRAREERLTVEQGGLQHPDPAALERQRAKRADFEHELAAARVSQDDRELALQEAEQRARLRATEVEAASAELAGVTARINALELLQQKLERDEHAQAWLEKNRLDGAKRLWQSLRIDPGWENALEAVLRERLNAIPAAHFRQSWSGDAPPAKITVFETPVGILPAPRQADPVESCSLLRDYLQCEDPAAAPVLEEWLHEVYVVADAHAARAACAQLPAGALVVTRQGTIVDRYSISFHAPDSELHGVLSRSLEIAQLRESAKAGQAKLELTRRNASDAEAEVGRRRAEITEARGAIEAAQRSAHDFQLSALKLSELAENATRRGAQIAQELRETAAQIADESALSKAARQRLEEYRRELADAEAALPALDRQFVEAETELTSQRERAQSAAREVHEASFNGKTCNSKIHELEESINVYSLNLEQLAGNFDRLLGEQRELDETVLQSDLQQALTAQSQKDAALAATRRALEDADHRLRETEQEKLASEQKMPPVQARIHEQEMKEQEARMIAEQYARELSDANADEAALAAMQEKGVKSATLQTRLGQLNEEIAALGAVNLAAFEELTTSEQRKTYLDSQADDLQQAIATLENAIRRIDRETRERLQETYERVNRQFGQMFPVLFGGGHAQLNLTGEEILDAGLQVIAQPPGKKNTSIHLLSGGEKALTALALVFSLFQLNPAPFCLLDEVDAPLDDSNTERFCELVRKMSEQTHFLFISHNKITMQMAQQLIGVTMQEQGVSRIVSVDIEEAMKMREQAIA